MLKQHHQPSLYERTHSLLLCSCRLMNNEERTSQIHCVCVWIAETCSHVIVCVWVFIYVQPILCAFWCIRVLCMCVSSEAEDRQTTTQEELTQKWESSESSKSAFKRLYIIYVKQPMWLHGNEWYDKAAPCSQGSMLALHFLFHPCSPVTCALNQWAGGHLCSVLPYHSLFRGLSSLSHSQWAGGHSLTRQQTTPRNTDNQVGLPRLCARRKPLCGSTTVFAVSLALWRLHFYNE